MYCSRKSEVTDNTILGQKVKSSKYKILDNVLQSHFCAILLKQSTMAKLLVFFIVGLALYCALAAPRQAQPKSEQFGENINHVGNDLIESMKKMLPDSKSVNKFLVDATKNFADSVEKGTKDLSEQADKSKPFFDNLFNDASGKIKESLEFIKGLAGEDFTKKTGEMRKSIESHVNTIFVEGKKIEEALKPSLDHAQETVKHYALDFLEKLANAGKRLKVEIDEAIAEKKPSH